MGGVGVGGGHVSGADGGGAAAVNRDGVHGGDESVESISDVIGAAGAGVAHVGWRRVGMARGEVRREPEEFRRFCEDQLARLKVKLGVGAVVGAKAHATGHVKRTGVEEASVPQPWDWSYK